MKNVLKLFSLVAVGFGCMKTSTAMFSVILLLFGCKAADDKNAPRNLYNPPTKSSFTATAAIDPVVRNASIVINPGNDHFVYHDDEGKSHYYSYTPSETLSKKVFTYKPVDARTGKPRDYVSKIAQNVTKGDAFQRAFDFSVLIVTIGDLREKAFQNIQVTKTKIEAKKKQITDFYQLFPCFSYENADGKTRCKLRQDDTTSPAASFETTKRCSKLKRLSKKFDELTDEDLDSFKKAYKECVVIEDEKKILDEEKKVLVNVYKTGKDMANEMLNTAAEFTNEYFLATTATKFDPDTFTEHKSYIKFNKQSLENNFELNSVEDIHLAIDFGLPRGGFEVYSVENGAISNYKLFTTAAGNKRLMFTLTNSEYELTADLSITSRPHLGVTAKGTFDAYFPSLGTTRQGVMSLEFDFEGEELEP